MLQQQSCLAMTSYEMTFEGLAMTRTNTKHLQTSLRAQRAKQTLTLQERKTQKRNMQENLITATLSAGEKERFS